MRNNEEIKELLDYLKTSENKELTFDEEAIFTEYQKDEDKQSLAIKILSVVGGIFAAGAFLGFIFMAGLYDSEIGLFIFGVLFVAGAIGINKIYDKIIMDTISVSFYIIGFILFGLGLDKQEVSEKMIGVVFIVFSLISLSLVQNYIISFVSILIIHGSIVVLVALDKYPNVMYIYMCVLVLIMTYVFVKEAKIITTNKALFRLYNPLRIGLVFSLMSMLVLFGMDRILPAFFYYTCFSSIVIIAAIMYVLFQLSDSLKITKIEDKIVIYTFSGLLLLPAILSPAILGAILIILLSFLVNYKVGLVVGIIAFIYFISQYYYNLSFTLLTKSMLLLSSGVLFLALYLFIHKKLASNEKV